MKGSAILNPNGSDLNVEHIDNPVYFDVKAFGLREHLAGQLARRLTDHFPAEQPARIVTSLSLS